MIEQRVTLRYGAQQIPAIVQAVQGDTGRDVIFELADYEIPAGATANYYIDKPDGNAVYNSAEVISSTEILAHLTEQALAAPGRNNGQVRILSDGEVITSFDFVLEVEAFRGILRLQSETEVNIFDEALQAAAEDAIAEIQAQTPVVTGMQNSIAPTYSSSSTYAVGDYVMYNAQLYKCNTAITTAEAWTEAHWIHVPIAAEVSDLKSAFKNNSVYNNPWQISGNLVDTYLPDLNSISTTEAYNKIFHFVPTSSKRPANLPSDAINESYYCFMQFDAGFGGGVTVQILFNDVKIWTRFKQNSTTWVAWTVRDNFINVVETIVGPSNYSTLLPDLNNAKANTNYTLIFTSATRPLNLPSDCKNEAYYRLITMSANDNKGGTFQILICDDNKIWLRNKTSASSWSAWKSNRRNETIVVDSSGNGDFTSFSRAVIYARNYIENATIKVNEGTYNLLTELNDIYPGYFTDYDPDDGTHFPDNRGLAIGWGMKIVFSPGAKLVCNYTQDDSVTQSFAPLYAYNSDFELVGCKIECAMVRYAIHDDPAQNSEKVKRWHHVYKDCDIYVDNSQSSRVFRNCIGGGFGKQSLIDVINCTFESVGVADNRAIVGWHNCVLDNSMSYLTITGCYFKTGTCGVTYYGPSTGVSKALISNNYVNAAPTIGEETQDSTNVNVELLAWNNIIAS